jgi:hypothetical protein
VSDAGPDPEIRIDQLTGLRTIAPEHGERPFESPLAGATANHRAPPAPIQAKEEGLLGSAHH